MDQLNEVVEELFGLHYNTNLEGMNDMISEEYFMASFDAEVAEKIDTRFLLFQLILHFLKNKY